MIITIGGKPVAGKGSVGRALAKHLGYEYLSIGDIWRVKAQEHNMTLNEFHVYCRTHPEYDRSIEDYQRGLRDHPGLVLDGRLGFYTIPSSFKVYLDVSVEEACRRLVEANRRNEKATTIQEAREEITTRARHETEKHLQQYGVDPHNLKQFDLVIDTTHKSVDSVVKEILTHAKL